MMSQHFAAGLQGQEGFHHSHLEKHPTQLHNDDDVEIDDVDMSDYDDDDGIDSERESSEEEESSDGSDVEGKDDSDEKESDDDESEDDTDDDESEEREEEAEDTGNKHSKDDESDEESEYDEMVMDDLKNAVDRLSMRDNDEVDYLMQGLDLEDQSDNRQRELMPPNSSTVVRGPVCFTGYWSPILHVSQRLLHFDLHLTDKEVAWCQSMMIARPTGDDKTRGLASYFREGRTNLTRRMSTIARMAVTSGPEPTASSFQFEIWACKLAHSPGQLEAFSKNFDLSKVLGCDRNAKPLPLTGAEVLALLNCLGETHGTGVDVEISIFLDILVVVAMFETVPLPVISPSIVDYFLKCARRSTRRCIGAGFGNWGLVNLEDSGR
ncbi:hypothetical protein TWF481_010926 [Arthrobotrys musiformis]|uniref:Uncharacterized protein n=1 Tax=Arthrobotrys musiformis TaxID=47236 RepID=A0AAV9VZA6_9PEZI